MTTRQQMHKELKDIPSEYFPIWAETLGYDRGLPHFRELSAFSEEGVLIPTAGGYTYQQLRRLPMPGSSQLSPTGHVGLEDYSPQMALLPSQNQSEMGGTSYPSSWQQTPWTSPQSTSSQIQDQPSGEDSSYDAGSSHYVYGIPAESSAMEEIQEQMHPRAMFTPSMDTTSGLSSAPHNMQWNPHGPVSPYDQVQGHDEPMTSPQQDVQMTEWVWLSPF